MKTKVVKFGLVLAAIGACSLVNAEPQAGKGTDGTQVEREGQKGQKGKRGPKGPSREEILNKYDTDGNGELSDAELEALKADRDAAREQRAEEGETSGERRPGGRGPDGERPGREEFIKRFDKDGDGELNEEERMAARKAMQKHRRGGGRGKEMMEKYDTDGDGQLSEEERAAARADFEKRRGEQGKGGPNA